MDTKGMLTNFIKTEFLRGRNGNVGEDEDLLAAGIIDSLGILQLVAFVEDRLGTQVPDEDVVYENFRSVAALSDYLAHRL